MQVDKRNGNVCWGGGTHTYFDINDENKKYISGVVRDTWSWSTSLYPFNETVTVPEGAYFMRISAFVPDYATEQSVRIERSVVKGTKQKVDIINVKYLSFSSTHKTIPHHLFIIEYFLLISNISKPIPLFLFRHIESSLQNVLIKIRFKGIKKDHSLSIFLENERSFTLLLFS